MLESGVILRGLRKQHHVACKFHQTRQPPECVLLRFSGICLLTILVHNIYHDNERTLRVISVSFTYFMK